ncbi:hypothetical protein PF005_g32446 [Phytophthora fragariae]|uniref:Uncharacterized protein n=1 Tax=Phytophthora fragariae TaxID=53985 RepID=A0A6A3UZV2_9STRA|nr:hypothetical protein PF005_g32446 [Phytophthora fragariae]
MRVIKPAGYDNFLVEREDTDGDAGRHIVHVSFLVTYYYPKALLKQAAADIAEQVDHERADEETASPVRATTAQINAATAVRGRKRGRRAARDQSSSRVSSWWSYDDDDAARVTAADDESQWGSIAEYDRLLEADRVVEDSVGEEGV